MKTDYTVPFVLALIAILWSGFVFWMMSRP